MNLSENTFKSIQGEGIFSGIPSLFIRVSGCTLKCSFCDTKFSWGEGKEISNYALIKKITESGIKHIVLTGGEPMLYQNDFLEIMKELGGNGYTYEIETNGTIPINMLFTRYPITWNVSPKLSNSGEPKEKRENEAVLKMFKVLDNSYFKFVISTKNDLSEVDELIKKYKIPNEKVLLMPEAKSIEEIKEKTFIVDHCISKGYRFSLRTHIVLWGNVKGK